MSDSALDDAERYATADAVVAAHPTVTLPVYVAPATASQTNTLRPSIAPLGCWRLSEALFDFDSSFIKPGVRVSAPAFATMFRASPGSLAAVFGHADPAGQDEHNKTLSGRRATAVYGMLVRDVALWQRLYDQPFGNDRWGERSVQTMLGAIIDPTASPPAPYYAGAITGVHDAATLAAVRNLQQHEGLTADGIVGPLTTSKLFRAYMDAICVDTSGAPFVMTPSQFVGQGSGKGAYQGCSELNPILLFSKADQARYDTGVSPLAERNARNAPNRRAMVFLFRPPALAAQGAWPCPSVSESTAGCRAMFWPDGDQRRAPGAAEREYRTDQRTMACSWYDRFARMSPCEGRVYTRIAVTLRDRRARLIEGAPYRMTAGDRSRTGRAPNAIAVLTVPGYPERCTVEWGLVEHDDLSASAEPSAYRLDLYVRYDVGSDEEQARKRLHNIGYPDSFDLDVALKTFQSHHALEPTGVLDDVTRTALIAAHGTLAVPVQTPDPDEATDGR